MTRVFLAGQAVLDFIFNVEELPTRPEKYRALNAQIIGGGCASNAAVAICRLGGQANLAARVGDDQVGGLIAEGLAHEGVDISNLEQVPGARSSYSSITVDATGERQIVNLRGVGFADKTDWTLPGFDAVLADTRWPVGALAALTLARQAGVPGVLDGEDPIDRGVASAASHIVFSVQGLRGFTGIADLPRALTHADADLPGWVAVTDGADGVLHLEQGQIVHIPAFKVDAVDTLGAGDVWHGAFALRLAEGASEHHAIRFANAVAALKCTRHGGRAGTPTRSETEAFLKERENAA